MKKMISIMLLISTQAFATDYLYKWNNEATSHQIDRANLLLDEVNLKLPQGRFIASLEQDLAIQLIETGAFTYIEEDREIAAPISNDLVEKSFDEVRRGWLLEKVNAKQAWNRTMGDPSIIVAFCDSGIDTKQPEFRGKVLQGWNFVGNNSNTNHYIKQNGSPNTHGTSVASYIAANFDADYNTGGVAPNVSLLPGLITNASGNTSMGKISSCIRWATDKGAKVINVSISGSGSKSGWDAARYAFNRGAVVVWSSGNSNRLLSAANLPEMLVVGGTDINDERYHAITPNKTYGSNFGVSVDTVAPGEGIFKPWGSHGKTNGTSYSAPIVSGVAALLFSRDPSLSPREVIRIIKESSTKLGREDYFGAGLVNARDALNLVR